MQVLEVEEAAPEVQARAFRVVCDSMLQGLARRLRCLGVDVLVLGTGEDHRRAAEVSSLGRRATCPGEQGQGLWLVQRPAAWALRGGGQGCLVGRGGARGCPWAAGREPLRPLIQANWGSWPLEAPPAPPSGGPPGGTSHKVTKEPQQGSQDLGLRHGCITGLLRYDSAPPKSAAEGCARWSWTFVEPRRRHHGQFRRPPWPTRPGSLPERPRSPAAQLLPRGAAPSCGRGHAAPCIPGRLRCRVCQSLASLSEQTSPRRTGHGVAVPLP